MFKICKHKKECEARNHCVYLSTVVEVSKFMMSVKPGVEGALKIDAILTERLNSEYQDNELNEMVVHLAQGAAFVAKKALKRAVDSPSPSRCIN